MMSHQANAHRTPPEPTRPTPPDQAVSSGWTAPLDQATPPDWTTPRDRAAPLDQATPPGRAAPPQRAALARPVNRAPGSEASSSGQAAPSGSSGLRLTGRGAVVVVFALCFLGLIISGWLGWGLLTGGSFVAACVLAATRTQRSDLLTVAVAPPAVFLVAVVCGKALSSPGGLLLSTTEGTLITLSNTAPWLLAGMALNLIIGLSRGLWGNVRALSEELHQDPVKAAQARQAGQSRLPVASVD